MSALIFFMQIVFGILFVMFLSILTYLFIQKLRGAKLLTKKDPEYYLIGDQRSEI